MLTISRLPLDRLAPAARLPAVAAVLLCGLLAAGPWAPASPALADVDNAKPEEAKTEPKAAKAPLKSEFHADFCGGNFDRDRLAPVGVDTLYAWSLLKPEPKGLRIAVPDHQGDKKPFIGVAPLVTVQGDFEITAGYEILALAPPQGDFHPGANLDLLSEKMQEQTCLRRCVTPDGVEAYRVRIRVGNRPPEWQSFPAQGKTGKLRLARTGATVEYSVAEGDGDDFRKLAKGEFGASPIALLRLDASTDGSRSTVDVVWKDLKIRAEGLKPVEIPLLRSGPRKSGSGAGDKP